MLRRSLLAMALLLTSGQALAGESLELRHTPPRSLEAGDTVQLDFNVVGRYASENPPTLGVHYRVAGALTFDTVEGVEIGYGLYRVTIPSDRLPRRRRRLTLQYYAELTHGAELLASYRNAIEPAVTFVVMPRPEPPPPDATTVSPDPRPAPRYRTPPDRIRGRRRAPAEPQTAQLQDPADPRSPSPAPVQQARAGIVSSRPLRHSDVDVKIGLNLGAMFGYEVFSDKSKIHLFEDLWVAWAPWMNVPGEFTLDVMFYLGWFYSVAPGMRFYFVRNNEISYSLGLRALVRFDPEAPVPGGGVTSTIEVGITRLIALCIAASADLTVWPDGSGPVPSKIGSLGEKLDYLVVPVFTVNGGLMFRF